MNPDVFVDYVQLRDPYKGGMNGRLSAHPALVVAPHPDDDVIGAGGAMAVMAAGGIDVFSLFVTGGGSPVLGGEGDAAVRRQESLDALDVVDACGAFFLDYASAQLFDDSATVTASLKAVFDRLRPGIVYLPAPFERHRTHVRVTALTLAALLALSNCRPQLWGYQVWGSWWGTEGVKTVDISSVVDVKQAAVQRHQSQLRFKAFDEGMLGRNRYEAVFAETHAPDQAHSVERFLDMSGLLDDPSLSLKVFAEKVVREWLSSLHLP
ncbi:MAG: hypothetical protein GY868_00095 [Deltaproteobacteria bacterium]|nr:hypothetical protein [Deltaproteobacteria bacterium]